MYLRVIVVSKRFKFQNMEEGSLRKKRNLYKITTFELMNNDEFDLLRIIICVLLSAISVYNITNFLRVTC